MADTLYLLYTLKDAMEWKEKEKAIRGKEALYKLIKYMFERDRLNFPNNIPELYSFLLMEPCHNYLDGISSREPFANPNGEINSEIKGHLEEDNPDEKIQADIMKTILLLCRNESKKILDDESDEETKSRENYWENIYLDARGYISETSIREKAELDIDIVNKFPSQISSIIKKGYLPDKRISDAQLVCPICGKIALKENSNLCENEVCNYYIKRNKLAPVVKNLNGKHAMLAPGLYKFILSPGIAEKFIYEKIKERFTTYEVALYPNIDEYDINVKLGEKVIHLDVKDAKTPEILLRTLLEESNIEKLKIEKNRVVWLVIPDHRSSIYSKTYDTNYLEKLKQLLQNEKLKIEVISEYHLLSRIEQEMEELFS